MPTSIIVASLLLAAYPTDAPQVQAGSWSQRQTWPIVVTGGVRALGFDPVPVAPHGSVGTELRFVARRIFSLQLGADAGMFAQPNFAVGGTLDATLMPRFTAPFGLYADVGVLVGGQLARVPGPVYRAPDRQPPRPARAPWSPAARIGLGASVGLDLSTWSKAPLRVFVRYRQLAQTPFMLGNGLPVMGVADLSAGLAVSLGGWRATR